MSSPETSHDVPGLIGELREDADRIENMTDERFFPAHLLDHAIRYADNATRAADALERLTAKEAGWRADRANTKPNWANCPSTHCERGEECRSPSECTVRTTGRRALMPAFKAHMEDLYGGPLPNWPEDPYRWDERYGGLPYTTAMATAFRTFMAGFDAALLPTSPEPVDGELVEAEDLEEMATKIVDDSSYYKWAYTRRSAIAVVRETLRLAALARHDGVAGGGK